MNKPTVLIVEDEAIVAADLAGKLKQLGYEVVGTAAGGAEAVESALRLRPHLVLMDIRLKGAMDGIEAAETIRRSQDVPVIYLTAHSDAATLARAKLTGPFGYILKPFEERELVTQIEMALYRHHIDRQLREQREWLRVTLTSIGDAVVATDASGRITFLNPAAESLMGWKAEEAAGLPLTNVFRIVNEKTGEALEEPVVRVLREGRAVALANHAALVTRDGRTVPIEDSAAPILDSTGMVIGAVLVFHDVTVKRRAEETLLQSEEKFRSAFANAAIGLAMTTPDGRFVDANPAYCSLMGYSVGEMRTLACRQLIHPEDVEEDMRLINQMIAGVIPNFVVENRYIPKDGKPVWVRKSVSLVRNAEGAPQWIIALIENITERKRIEDELRKSRDELELRIRERTAELRTTNEALRLYATRLEQSNRDLEDFAFVTSHDLQEPARKIQTLTDRLATLTGPAVGEKAKDYLERVQSAARRMQELVLDLLKYSRVTSNPEPFTRFNLKDPVEEAVTDLSVLVEEMEGRIEVGELPEVEADRVQMRQLFQNLIGNGLKYRGEPKPVIRIYSPASNPSPSGLIHVEDNGIGFDECYADRIFKPFQRLHSRNASYSGTGMGLAICRRIVERHNGTITAKSAPGRGSTFIIALPQKRREK